MESILHSPTCWPIYELYLNFVFSVKIIFRGGGKRIKEMEKKAYHKSVDVYWQANAWADTEMSCEWVRKTLKPAIPEGEEFVLLCDNLKAQVSEEFLQAIRNINGIVYYGVPGESFYSIVFQIIELAPKFMESIKKLGSPMRIACKRAA